ncbi:S-formylglutathione hydrolase FrmB [Sphingobium sp. B1D7B]|uniref:alpha/beta hydrolase n=1 Tax=Sphingobium sp. B1D7B TaxID=2940578 RepID=UPI002224334C|nr:alpha/beta hydrolase-fold protein [Sphingobium sp. B1D7B]MCW2405416.1 S-formylglutathione hydrolase FrmB [Sphingobium sp. B1D7B]
MTRKTSAIHAALLAGLCLAMPAAPALAQVATNAPTPVPGAPKVTLERIKVHSPAIAGNLEGESADRDVIVVLPPSYATNRAKRYPVVYALHGYSIGAEQWIGEIHVPQVIEGALAKGAQEMILVFPDSKTIHNGSMYSSSATTGDFERFISHDLIAYIDSHYRTLATPRSRGLVGHSMGGYGAARIGMKHADQFGALYLMSPCCLSARDAFALDEAGLAQIAGVKSPADSANLPFPLRAQLAVGAAWSPNPQKPPLYLDLPGGDEAQRNAILAKWAANAPLAFVDQYIGALKGYAAIAMDVGDQDSLKTDTETLHKVLDSYGIANSFTLYEGTHTSHVAFRFQDHVLPFFSTHLVAKAGAAR